MSEETGSASAEDAAHASGFVDDLHEIARSFGEAAISPSGDGEHRPAHGQSAARREHRPGDWLDRGEDAEEATALQRALTVSFARAAGSVERGKLAAVAFNVFVLLYVPCMATVAAMRHEFGGRWMLYQMAYTLLIAWLVATLVYQGGLLLGIG